MPRPTYDDATRAEAIALAGKVGAAEAGRQLGINQGTIASWVSRAGLASAHQAQRVDRLEAARQSWAERRATLTDEAGEVAALALAAAKRAVRSGEGREAKDFATVTAILVDKAQLLSGAATSRSELQHQARDHVLADARNRALRLVG